MALDPIVLRNIALQSNDNEADAQLSLATRRLVNKYGQVVLNPDAVLDVKIGGTPYVPFMFMVHAGALFVVGDAPMQEWGLGIDSLMYNEGNNVHNRNITSLSFENLNFTLQKFQVQQCPALTSLRAPKLKMIGRHFSPNTFPLLTEFYFPELTRVGVSGESLLGTDVVLTGLTILTTIDLPKLVSVAGSFQIGNVSTGSNTALTTLNVPALETCGVNVNLNTNPALLAASFPKLKWVGFQILLSNAAACTTLALPSLEFVRDAITANSGNGNITTVQIGSTGTLKTVGANVNFSGQKLTQASVDHILAQLAALDGTNGTTAYGTGKTVTLNGGTNSTPSAAGLASKATLVARGATVLNN